LSNFTDIRHNRDFEGKSVFAAAGGFLDWFLGGLGGFMYKSLVYFS
jgi:hypothetical protein